MRYLIILLLGAALGAGIYWYFSSGRGDSRVRNIERQAGDTAEAIADSIRHKISQIDLEAIREELSRTGRVIRQKAGQATAIFKDDGSDARIATALRGKIAAERALAPREISVSTRQGTVTLSGTVASHEEIALAMKLAFEIEGVREVVSELQIRRVK